MPKFIITRKVVQTSKVITASNEIEAFKIAYEHKSWMPDDVTTTIQELLPEPERRVVIRAVDDVYAYDEFLGAAGREGVWGYVCEQRTIVNGSWEHVDSSSGFLGGAGMLLMMREYMPEEFREIEPIDECDARK